MIHLHWMCQTLLMAPDAELLKEDRTGWLLLAQHWQSMAAAAADLQLPARFQSVMIYPIYFLIRELLHLPSFLAFLMPLTYLNNSMKNVLFTCTCNFSTIFYFCPFRVSYRASSLARSESKTIFDFCLIHLSLYFIIFKHYLCTLPVVILCVISFYHIVFSVA